MAKKPKKRTPTKKKRATTATASRNQRLRQERLAKAPEISLDQWLAILRERDAEAEAGSVASVAADSFPERGACLVKDPRTGQFNCIRTTRDTCKGLKGAFMGGPCGG